MQKFQLILQLSGKITPESISNLPLSAKIMPESMANLPLTGKKSQKDGLRILQLSGRTRWKVGQFYNYPAKYRVGGTNSVSVVPDLDLFQPCSLNCSIRDRHPPPKILHRTNRILCAKFGVGGTNSVSVVHGLDLFQPRSLNCSHRDQPPPPKTSTGLKGSILFAKFGVGGINSVAVVPG